MKKLLVQIDDIIKEFNTGKNPDGPRELDLNEEQLKHLGEVVDEI